MKLFSALLAIVLCHAAATAAAQERAADSSAPPPPVAAPDPEAAAARVTHALKDTQGLPAGAVTVAIHAGTIVLTGEVDSEAQRLAARTAAEKAAEGVRVSEKIELRPLQERPLKDQLAIQQSAQLVRDVEAALKADSRTKNLGIAVASAEPKVILLQGLVASREDRTAAQQVVLRVKGVTRVDNRLLTPADPVPASKP